MVTLADVAAVAGVSKSTASRAINHPSLVASSTVARVAEAAERLGFVHNRAARGLAHGSTGLVALVVPTLDNAFFSPIVGGAQARAAESGLLATVAVHEPGDPDDAAALARLASQVDGFVAVAPRGSDAAIGALAARAPLVLVDREVDGVSSVVADTAGAFAAVVAALAADGHRRIAYLGGPSGSWQHRQREGAMRSAADDAGAELVSIGPAAATARDGAAAADAVVSSGATAVVPYATALGLGLMLALGARGVRVPDDIVVSVEPPALDALGIAGVPAVQVDGAALGRAAGEALDALLADPATAGETVRLDVPVVRSGG